MMARAGSNTLPPPTPGPPAGASACERDAPVSFSAALWARIARRDRCPIPAPTRRAASSLDDHDDYDLCPVQPPLGYRNLSASEMRIAHRDVLAPDLASPLRRLAQAQMVCLGDDALH